MINSIAILDGPGVAIAATAFFIGVAVTYFFGKGKTATDKKRLTHLENEMLANHREILSLQKKNSELKSEKDSLSKQLSDKLLQSNNLRID